MASEGPFLKKLCNIISIFSVTRDFPLYYSEYFYIMSKTFSILYFF